MSTSGSSTEAREVGVAGLGQEFCASVDSVIEALRQFKDGRLQWLRNEKEQLSAIVEAAKPARHSTYHSTSTNCALYSPIKFRRSLIR